MSESGERLIEGATEAAAVASGSIPAHSMTINGHTYYSEPAIASWGLIELMVKNPELSERISDLESRLEKAEAERDAAKMPPSLTPEQLADACLSYRHDFGLMSADERFKLRWEAAEWWRCLTRALKDKS